MTLLKQSVPTYITQCNTYIPQTLPNEPQNIIKQVRQPSILDNTVNAPEQPVDLVTVGQKATNTNRAKQVQPNMVNKRLRNRLIKTFQRRKQMMANPVPQIPAYARHGQVHPQFRGLIDNDRFDESNDESGEYIETELEDIDSREDDRSDTIEDAMEDRYESSEDSDEDGDDSRSRHQNTFNRDIMQGIH